MKTLRFAARRGRVGLTLGLAVGLGLAVAWALAGPAFGGAAAAPAVSPADAALVPSSLPEEVGLSSERLARIGRIMEEHVAQGRIAGALGLIARRGKVAYFESWGFQDRETKKPMAKDAIFRMYSMTKAVTGVAALILHEERGFPLSTPASRWLPELAGMSVAVDRVDPLTGERSYHVEPARSEITVRDLLRHTSGLSYRGPVDQQAQLVYQKLGVASREQTLEDFVKRLAQAPLHDHPGTVWRYGYSTDVLGRLVEVISGQPFDRFLEERIFRPLGMTDTTFYVPAEKRERLAVLYAPGEGDSIKRATGPSQDGYLEPPTIFWGGAGLVSTAQDYLRFCLMLLRGGELDGVRVLSPKTVELIAADHLGDLPRVGDLIGPHDGFGLTVRVVREPGLTGALGSPGEYSWGGAAGTRFWIDPHEDMVTLFLIQTLPADQLPYGSEFKNLVYQSIVD